MPGVELTDVTKHFGAVTAVDEVSLAVPDGELLVLVGPSGCGKTTLLRLVAGLEQPEEGEVSVDDRRVTDLPARKRDVSLVFQDFALFPHLSARENVSFDLRMQGYDDVDRRVRETAELLDVADLLDRPIDELSGGQKQRIALGRAIVTEPSAFLLDEPLANLDANLRERMQTEIARLQAHLDVTTVHVTHDQAEALQLGDRVAVMSAGRIEQVGAPETVYRRPETVFVAQFVGNPTMNLLRGRLERRHGTATVVAEDGTITVPVADPADQPGVNSAIGEPVVLGVRPEQVAVARSDRTGDGWVRTDVQFDAFQGADRFVYLAGPGATEFVARVPGTSTFEAGEQLSVSLTDGRVHLFDAETGDRLPVDGDRLRAATERPDGGGSERTDWDPPERDDEDGSERRDGGGS